MVLGLWRGQVDRSGLPHVGSREVSLCSPPKHHAPPKNPSGSTQHLTQHLWLHREHTGRRFQHEKVNNKILTTTHCLAQNSCPERVNRLWLPKTATEEEQGNPGRTGPLSGWGMWLPGPRSWGVPGQRGWLLWKWSRLSLAGPRRGHEEARRPLGAVEVCRATGQQHHPHTGSSGAGVTEHILPANLEP